MFRHATDEARTSWVPVGLRVAVAALIPVLLFVWVALDQRAVTLRGAERMQLRMVEAVAQHTDRMLSTQALILDVLDRAADGKTCEQLRADPGLQSFIEMLAQEPTLTRALWVIGADGFLCLSSAPNMLDTKTRADRDYFILARMAGPGGFAVGHATFGRIDDVPIFNFAKARTKDGAFNGVILASPRLADLLDDWRKEIGFGSSERMELVSNDGGTIARSWPPLVPRETPATSDGAAAWSAEATGVRTMPVQSDGGAMRILAWQRLPKWGVVVTSSIRQANALAPWRRSMRVFAPFVLVASGVLGLLTWQLLQGQLILARRIAERTRELRDNEARFGALVEAMPQMAFVMRADGRAELLNQRWAEFTGETLSADTWDLIGSVHPDDRDAMVDGLARAQRTGVAFSVEHRLRGLDGRYRWFLTHMRKQAAAPPGTEAPWIGTATDISEIVAAREALARSRDELEALVADRTRDLQETQSQLAHVQRLESLGQLTGGIAHDFNNILQAVQGGAQLIRRHVAEPSRVASLAAMLRDTAERGAAITRRLLIISRRSELQPEPIDPAALLREMQEFLSHTLGAGITIRAEAAPDVPPLLADRGQLETVLINLATNARDAMAGAGTLTVSATSQIVPEDTRMGAYGSRLRAGAYVCLTVQDGGSGMTPEVLARACEPFFTTKAAGHGTGLGLAITRGFMEQSGGGMAIDSQIGQGTTVRLWLPAAQADAARQDLPLIPAHTKPADGRRILLAEDEANVRETLREELEAEGFAVVTARNGPEALMLFEHEAAFDIVITDLSMPELNGLQLIQALHRRCPSLPAILLTGYVTNAAELALGGAVSGSFTLLQKPVRTAALVERVNVLLEAARPGQTPIAVSEAPEGEAV